MSDETPERVVSSDDSDDDGSLPLPISVRYSQEHTDETRASTVRYYFAQQQHRMHPNMRRKKANARKPCNCSRSKCLKLYCECFSSGQMCVDCNCKDCHNNIGHEGDRLVAVKSTLEKNPTAFAPKIAYGNGGGVGGSRADSAAAEKISLSSQAQLERSHRSGCNCRKTSCVKNYCECYEAKVPCSDRCKCRNCHNSESERVQRDCLRGPASAGLIGLAATASMDFTGSNSSSSFSLSDLSDEEGVEVKRLNREALKSSPAMYLDDQVVEACTRCFLTSALQVQTHDGNEGNMELAVLGEFSRCMNDVLSRTMEGSEDASFQDLSILAHLFEEDVFL